MSSTLLQIVQRAMGEMGLFPLPTGVAGNPTQQVQQVMALANAVGYELMTEHDWQAINVQYAFTSVYTQTTGDVADGSAVVSNIPDTTGLDTTYQVVGNGINQATFIQSVDSATQVTLTQPANVTAAGATLYFCKTKYTFPATWNRQINRTHWDKTKHWEMLGPETAQQWEWLMSGFIATGPRIRYRILGNYFQIWPPLTSNEYLGLEYITSDWALSSTGATKSSMTEDTDTCIYQDNLMVAGIKMKYFQLKGFDASAFERDYRAQLNIAKAADAGAPTLSFAPTPASVLIDFSNIPDSGYGVNN